MAASGKDPSKLPEPASQAGRSRDVRMTTAQGPGAGVRDVEDPNGEPAWHAPAGPLSDLPYAAVGRVRVLRNGQEFEFGTCWRTASNIAITAAHVMEAVQGPLFSVRLDFPGEPNVPVVRFDVAKNYRAQQPVDPWDIARLELPPGPRSFLGMGAAGNEDLRVVGFPAREIGMVESEGAALQPDAVLLLHRADTAGGHSGGPVLKPRTSVPPTVVGIHIGGFRNNPLAQAHPRHNVALKLRDEILKFISGQVS
jgi:V8-like Glu-specific endopeptidase